MTGSVKIVVFSDTQGFIDEMIIPLNVEDWWLVTCLVGDDQCLALL